MKNQLSFVILALIGTAFVNSAFAQTRPVASTVAEIKADVELAPCDDKTRLGSAII
jgi:hypothetical protein